MWNKLNSYWLQEDDYRGVQKIVDAFREKKTKEGKNESWDIFSNFHHSIYLPEFDSWIRYTSITYIPKWYYVISIFLEKCCFLGYLNFFPCLHEELKLLSARKEGETHWRFILIFEQIIEPRLDFKAVLWFITPFMEF